MHCDTLVVHHKAMAEFTEVPTEAKLSDTLVVRAQRWEIKRAVKRRKS